MVNSGGELEQFQHSYRNMGVKLKAGKLVIVTNNNGIIVSMVVVNIFEA